MQHPLRRQYEDTVGALGVEAAGKLAAGDDPEHVAHWIVAQRNALKLRFRDLTPADDRTRLEAWTQARYGNPLGPTITQLRSAGKSWHEIIDGASRPGLYRGKP